MRRTAVEPLAAKVPEITALFWVIKVLTTGMGEATSDYLGQTNLALGGVVGVGGLALAMWLQLRSRRYHAPTYWFAVAMVAVFGTIAADVVHVVLALPYAVTTCLYAAATAAVLTYWYRTEGTLSIHSIRTRRRERLYWTTVLLSFALGTAAGDLTALALHWGFLASGWLFLGAIAVPLVAWRAGLNGTAAFWSAYVLTRPLGASFADWLGKDHRIGGGLGYGDGLVSVVALGLIVVLVGVVTSTRSDVQREEARDAPVVRDDALSH
ncbi:MAG: hypothetical protein JWP14_3193 [Frankiales bacterium]|jgi:uncharacterized membrane-anchored protein|nr:hypothetical protein [Frankiales bacterium]